MKINSTEKLIIFKKAITKLIGRGLLLVDSFQDDMADKMKANYNSVNYAYNGRERYLTDLFLKRFNSAFEGIFNENWLLAGEGSMLKNEPKGNATYNAYIKKMMNQVNRVAVESLTDSDLMDMLDNAGKDESELEIGVKRINKGGMRGSVCGFNRKKIDE